MLKTANHNVFHLCNESVIRPLAHHAHLLTNDNPGGQMVGHQSVMNTSSVVISQSNIPPVQCLLFNPPPPYTDQMWKLDMKWKGWNLNIGGWNVTTGGVEIWPELTNKAGQHGTNPLVQMFENSLDCFVIITTLVLALLPRIFNDPCVIFHFLRILCQNYLQNMTLKGQDCSCLDAAILSHFPRTGGHKLKWLTKVEFCHPKVKQGLCYCSNYLFC